MDGPGAGCDCGFNPPSLSGDSYPPPHFFLLSEVRQNRPGRGGAGSDRNEHPPPNVVGLGWVQPKRPRGHLHAEGPVQANSLGHILPSKKRGTIQTGQGLFQGGRGEQIQVNRQGANGSGEKGATTQGGFTPTNCSSFKNSLAYSTCTTPSH